MRPSSVFDPKFYLAEYPDLNGMPLLNHYLNYGHKEGRRKVGHRLPDHIRKEIDCLVHIEPLLGGVKQDLDTVIRYPFITGATYLPRIIQRRYKQDIKIVICVPFVSIGGADLISIYLLKAYQKAFGERHVLLIVTDSPTVDMQSWLPDGTRHFCLDNESGFIKHEEKVAALHNIVGLLDPLKVVNVNSRACWDLYREFGMQLASVLDLNAYLFCFDYDAQGDPVGYIPEYIPELVKYLKCVFCDNRTVIEDMRRIYGFSDMDMAIFHTVYVPAPEDAQPRKVRTSRRADKILWIGRLARQKQPDALVKIAGAMPYISFEVYGPPGDSPVSDSIVRGDYPNIRYRGVYSNLAELDTSRYALYLNTSKWEGLPTILIQMMSIGMPVVTSLAGGISELVDDQTGWIATDPEQTETYCALINKAIILVEDTNEKVGRGLQRIAGQHTWARFFDRLNEVGAFRHDSSNAGRKIVPFDRRNRSQGEANQAAHVECTALVSTVDTDCTNDDLVCAEQGHVSQR
jgi:glycosyltransferase involved in cell wall biosynthesis